MRAIKKNLKTNPRGQVMYCKACGNRNSADAGDYWYVEDDYEFRCSCGEPMILGHFVTKFVEDKGGKS